MKNFIDKATKAFRVASCVIFAFIIIVTMVNIIGRTLFNAPISGAVEIIEYGFMLAIAVVMASTGFENKHVSVDLVTMNLGPKGKKAFYIFGSLCGVIAFGIIAYLCLTDAITYTTGTSRLTETLHLPYSVLYFIIFAGFALGTLVFLFQLIEAIKDLVTDNCGPDLRKLSEEEKAKRIAELAEQGDLDI